MESLSLKASNLKSGAQIITFTKELSNPNLKIIDRRQYVMSWIKPNLKMINIV